MDILTRDVNYAFRGLEMRGWFAAPRDTAAKGAARPGVLIVPDAFGLDAYCMGVAEKLAAFGCAALAVDLWGGRKVLTEAGPPAMALTADSDEWMGRVGAARDALVAQPGVDKTRIAAIGYCLGGSTVLEMARLGQDLKGVVSFHGSLDMLGPDWAPGRATAKLLVCTGAEDPLVSWESITTFQARVRKAEVNWELAVYSQAKHSFTRPDAVARSSPDRVGYNYQADSRSWRACEAFLAEVLA